MTNAAYGKLTAGLVSAWFIFVLAASALDVFKNASNWIGLPVALAALVLDACSMQPILINLNSKWPCCQT